MMKRLFATVACTAVLAFTGCDKGSTPGGPGATNRGTGGVHLGQEEKSFSLSTPMTSTTIKQGETKDVSISIKRGKNYDDDVAIKFDNLPKGVTLDPASPMIKHGDKETKIAVKAAGDAAVGDFTIDVTGQGKEGPPAKSTLKIKIDKK